MINVIKKNGEHQKFNAEKIRKAIRKSATRVCIELTDKEEKQVVDSVKKQLQFQETDIGVDTIHNMVEVALDHVNADVAKSYREYRDNRKQFSEMLDKVYSKKLSLNFIGDRSNANSDSALVTTQKAIVYNELNSELYKKFFLTQKEERAMSDGYIYIHDRGSRLDTMNCCLFDMKNLLTGGFFMGNLDYLEPKSLDVAFDLIADVTLNAASSQYGGFTIPEVDKLLAPYAEKSYKMYYDEYMKIAETQHDDWNEVVEDESTYSRIKAAADEYATGKVKREFEQGFQSWEMKFNSVASSRGDYPFTALTFGLGTGKWESMASSICMKVRAGGQGKPGLKHPVLFPKLSFFYDENLHDEGKELEWLFNEALDCSMKTMYPDFISCTGDGYAPRIYKKYGTPISRMGCIDYTEKITVCNIPRECKGGVQPHEVMIGEFYNHIAKGNRPREFATTRVKNIVAKMNDAEAASKFLKYGYMFYDGEQLNAWAVDFRNKMNRKPTRGDVEDFFGRPLERKSVRDSHGIDSTLFNLWDSYLEVKVVDCLIRNGFVEKHSIEECTSDKDFVRNKLWKTDNVAKWTDSAFQIDIYFPVKKTGFEVEDFATHSKTSDNEPYLINGLQRPDMSFKKGPTYFANKKTYFESIGINVFELWEDDIRNGSYASIVDSVLGIKLDLAKKIDRVISEIHTEDLDYIDIDALGITKYVKDIDGSYTRILRVIKNKNVNDWLMLTLDDGKQLVVTTDHPLITVSGQLPASELSIGDVLFDVDDNEVQITDIQRIEKTANSYDIETESGTFVFSGIQSHNCRANLSPWYERGGMEPADDNDKPVYNGRFNLGAISLHFSMIAAKAKKEDKDFFEVLEYYLDMVRGIHKRTFEFLSHKKAGINPLGFCQGGFYGGHKGPDEELGEDFLRPMTMSFGIIGLNEASVYCTGKAIHEDNSWAVSVLKFINDYADKYKKIDNILYAIYGTPGESLVGLQAQQFKKKYGIVKGVSDHEYVTNSFHCPVYADITPIQKQDAEYPLFHLCNGGNIAYARLRSNYNFDAFKALTKRAMKMGFYWGNNQQLDFCEKCGHSFIDSDVCPQCGSDEIVRIERMNGYLGLASIRGRTMYSDAKMTEFKERISM